MNGVETAVGRAKYTPCRCNGLRAGDAVRILRRVILLALACVALVGVTGCGDGKGTGTTVVTAKADLDSGPRGLKVDLVNPDWLAVYTSGETAVAIGQDGSIRYSSDGGTTWETVESGTDRHLLAVHGEGERLVAVGVAGTILGSEDGGKTWDAVESGTDQHLRAVHGKGERLVAVGDSGAIMRSEDGGKNWYAVESGSDWDLLAAHGEGERLVAIGAEGAILGLEDGGTTWETVEMESGTVRHLRALHGEGERLVAVGDLGAIRRSEDGGKTWDVVKSGTVRHLRAVHGEGERLVAVGVAGAILGSEDGGKSWDEVESRTDRDLLAVHGEGERLVAAGEFGAIMRSENGGTTWDAVESGTDWDLLAAHGEGERLVAVGAEGAIIRSEDGSKTWDAVESGTDRHLWAVHGEDEQLVAVGDSGTIMRSEEGGTTWDAVESGTDRTLLAVHGGGERLVAVGVAGTILGSEDGGKTWDAVESGTDRDLRAVHGEAERLVAVGKSGAIMRSEDGGKTWDAVESGTNQYLRAVHGEGERLVAAGDSGAIMRSEDGGKTWDAVESSTDWDLQAVHVAGERLVAVTRFGTILRSEDGGKTWIRVRFRGRFGSDYSKTLMAIHGDRLRLVAVGHEIVALTATGPRFPLLDRIDYAPSVTPGRLELRFQIRDPDKQCAPDCQLRVMGGTKTDNDRRRPFDELDVQPRRTHGTDTWVTTLNPEDEFAVQPGQYLYLDATLSGPGFSMRYPLGDSPIRVGYLIDYTFYYIGLALLVVVAGLLLVFWLRPLWILLLYRRAGLFELAGKIPVPGVADALQVLGNLLVLPWLARRPRVLDAWLAQHRPDLKTLFRREEAVERLPYYRYYPLPLRRQASNERIRSPAPIHFKDDFAASRTLMQILGPGGSGKTSVAAELGKWSLEGALRPHPMLPIWLDEDITDLGAWLLKRVRAVTADADLPETFIQALFRRKRLWVIADRLSEKQAATQKAVCDPPAYLNALVVTSRTAQDFGLPDVRVIEALPLSSENLMGFVNDLLESRRDDEAFRGFRSQVDLARRLADIITIGQQELPVTPLLVSLFVKRALEQAMGSGAADLDRLPRSVPDVYFDYLRSVNPGDPSAANYCPHEVMIEGAKLIARIELGDDFRPKRIPKTVLVEALREAGLSESCAPLRRLLDNHVLEQKDIGGTTLVAFALDPIAEYVAAFAHAQACGANRDRWQTLHDQIAQVGEGAEGFKEALRVTHEVYGAELGWP